MPGVYEAQGLRNGAPTNRMKGPAFQTEPDTAYPDCRLVVTKETMTVEVVYELLKDKLNIAKLTFTGGVNAASQEYSTAKTVERCPLCVWRSMKTAYARHAAIRRHNRRAQRSLHKRRAEDLRVFLSGNTRSRAAGVCPAQPIKKGHLAVAFFDGRLHKRQKGNESRRHPPIGRNGLFFFRYRSAPVRITNCVNSFSASSPDRLNGSSGSTKLVIQAFLDSAATATL